MVLYLGRYIIRIGICGAHSVGKTTLLNALRSEDFFKDYVIADGVTRKLKKRGMKINEAGDDDTQRAVMDSHIVNAFLYDNMLTDRTAVDGYVYTAWLYSEGKVSEETLNYAVKVMEKVVPLYDIIFYIKPEFDIVDDGVRSTDLRFRDQIAELFDITIKMSKINVYPLTGSVRNRVDQAIKTLVTMKVNNTLHDKVFE